MKCRSCELPIYENKWYKVAKMYFKIAYNEIMLYRTQQTKSWGHVFFGEFGS